MVTREALQDEWEACVAAVRRALAAGYKEVGAACYLEGIAHAELFAMNAELGDLEVLPPTAVCRFRSPADGLMRACLLQEAVRALRECVQTEPEHEWAQDELADLERMLEEEHASKEAPKDEQPPTDL